MAKLEAQTQQALAAASAPPWKQIMRSCGGASYAIWNISGCQPFTGEWRAPGERTDDEIDQGVRWYIQQAEPCVEPPSRSPEEQWDRHLDRQCALAFAYLAAHGFL